MLYDNNQISFQSQILEQLFANFKTGVMNRNSITEIEYEEFTKTYKLCEPIGEGNYGCVRKIQKYQDNSFYALKIMKLKNVGQAVNGFKQIQKMSQFEHPLIIKIHKYFFFRQESVTEVHQLGIIMELGIMSLDKYILKCQKQNAQFKIQKIQTFAKNFIRLFAELQQRKLTHRDIKPANIIITHLQKFQCKLTDFGLSKRFISVYNNKEFAGTPHYASPQLSQIWNNKTTNPKINLIKNDVYSFGVTLYQLVCLQTPSQYFKIDRKMMKSLCGSSCLVQLIQTMLEHDEQRRPTFMQLLSFLDKPHKRSETESAIDIKKSILKVQKQDYKLQYHKKLKQSFNCILIVDQMIFVGTLTGKLIVCFQQSFVELKNVHQSSGITHLCKHSNTVWSGDCTGKILIWDVDQVRKELKSLKPPKIQKCAITDTLLYTNYKIDNPSLYQQLKIPCGKSGISKIYVVSNKFYVVGYFNGTVYINLDGKQYHKMIFDKMITSIKHKDNMVYIANSGGFLKKIDLTKFELVPKFYQVLPKSWILDIILYETEICLINMDGTLIYLNYDFYKLQKESIANSEVEICYSNNNRCILVTQKGQLIEYQRSLILLNMPINSIDQKGKLIYAVSAKGDFLKITSQ